MVVPDGVAADAVLRRPGGPFRMCFLKQSLAWSCQTGLPPTRFYAGLAGRFVCGFVSNLLRFLPGRGPPTWLRPPGVPFRVWFCEQSSAFSSRRGGHQLGYAGLACRFVTGFVSNLLRFLPDGGAANLVTPAWRAVSCVVL